MGIEYYSWLGRGRGVFYLARENGGWGGRFYRVFGKMSRVGTFSPVVDLKYKQLQLEEKRKCSPEMSECTTYCIKPDSLLSIWHVGGQVQEVILPRLVEGPASRRSPHGARTVARLVVSRTVWRDSVDTPQQSPPVTSIPSSPPMPGYASTWCSGRTVDPHRSLSPSHVSTSDL